MGSQRERHNWATELKWTEPRLLEGRLWVLFSHSCPQLHTRIIMGEHTQLSPCTHIHKHIPIRTSAHTHLHVQTHMRMHILRRLSPTPDQLNEISENGMSLEHRFLKGPPRDIKRQWDREPLTSTPSKDHPALKTLGSSFLSVKLSPCLWSAANYSPF